MAKKPKPTPGQLSLFDTTRYEKALSYSNYDIEDGYEDADDWPPKVVSESTEEFVSESTEEFVSESTWPPDPPDDSLTFDSLTTSKPCGAVGKYHSGGNTRGRCEYWRFSYRVGNKVKQVHIPGGCCTNPRATSRAAEVREAIATGSSAPEVLELIRSFTKKHQ